MRWTLVAFLAMMGGAAAAPPAPPQSKPHHCAREAVTQAEKLLRFHFGEDDQISIDSAATVLPSIRNPAAPPQRFDVLEVWGYIYKGRYRMHLIYARMPDQCVLVGQEILEYARL